ncbi:6-phosphogluconolactonase [Bradyrhizobium sp. WD16]|nr:6-phosphogluconolactonase [Bradyrhizobium sp. WD16]
MFIIKLATLTTTLLPLAAIAMSAAARAETFAYVGNADSNDITVLRLSDNGEMTMVETVPFSGVAKAGGSTPLAVSPDRRRLYAGVRSEPFQVLTFAIDGKTGRLTFRGSAPLADSMANIAADRSGKFLFSASYGGNKVALNPIGDDGVVEAPKQVIPTGLNAHAFLPSPDNRFAFATSLGSDQVLGFGFDATRGVLTPMAAPVAKLGEKNGPRHFVFHPDGTSVYLLNELSAALIVYGYDAASGAWREVQTTSALPQGFAGKAFEGKPWAADLHLTSDGRFLYASERTSSTIAAFRVEDGGRLAPLGSVPTQRQPRGFAIDPSGRVLAAVGELSDAMTVYAIDGASGALRPVQTLEVGGKPNWVEFVTLP